MPCNCKEMEGFELIMFKAKEYERRTGKKAAVFVVNKKTPSFTDLDNVSKVSGICCYFTTDGVEHELDKPEVVEEVVNVENIEVESETIEQPKKKNRSKKSE